MKITFFGSSNFALPILEKLAHHYQVVTVVTTPDQPVGRKQELSPTPIARLAEELNIPILKPESLKQNSQIIEQLKNNGSDMFIVAAYGKIIPQEILDIPPKGNINVHPSLLPLLRGASPIQYALLEGLETTGTSIMLMDKEVDHGPILKQISVEIEPDDTFIILQDRLARASAELLLDTLPEFISGTLSPSEQDHTKASFTKIIKKEDGKADWNKHAQEIYNQFRAFYPWPGLWTTWQGQTLKIIECVATLESLAPEKKPGEVLSGGLVTCGGGTVIQLIEVQLSGKNETDIKSFLNGYPQFIGSSLE